MRQWLAEAVAFQSPKQLRSFFVLLLLNVIVVTSQSARRVCGRYQGDLTAVSCPTTNQLFQRLIANCCPPMIVKREAQPTIVPLIDLSRQRISLAKDESSHKWRDGNVRCQRLLLDGDEVRENSITP
jgi:hypothetical protein